MNDDREPRLDTAPTPPATDPLGEPSPDPDPEKAARAQEMKAPPEDNDLRCTLCGLRACWSG